MSVPPQFQAALVPGEDLLWHSPAHASDVMSDYGGQHDFIARLFLGLSALTTLVFFLGMQNEGRFGLSIPLLLFVGGPIVIGLTIRSIGRRRERAKAKQVQYGVTSHRILVAAETLKEAYVITADSTADIIQSTNDRAVLRYVAGGRMRPYEMMLPRDAAQEAQTVINLVKAAL